MPRGRAPTITIDTTAVGAPQHDEEGDIPLNGVSNSPISPHDTFGNSQFPTSPTHLTVPSISRRGNSIDSGSLSGETFAVPPSRGSDLSGPGDSEIDLINDRDALKPDPGTEAEFNVPNNKFAFSPGQLSKLFNPKSYAAFHALGGLAGLEKGLRTDLKAGLSSDENILSGEVSFEEAVGQPDSNHSASSVPNQLTITRTRTSTKSIRRAGFSDRRRVFADNHLPERPTKNLLQLMWMAYNDRILQLLSVAAIVSLAIGIYQSVDPSQHKHGEAPIEWVEGVAIMIAIAIVVIVGGLNDWQKERQFAKLNKKKEDRLVKVLRSGKLQEISVYDVLVGDVVDMQPGDIIPADGIFIEGHNLTCDESSTTGESDLMKKRPAAEVFQALESHEIVKKLDPFILSGAKVNEGVGKFVATATGVNSTWGRTMMSLREENEVTPLQSKLNLIATTIAKLGGAAAIFYFIVAFIEFLVHITAGSETCLSPAQKGQNFLQIFIISVSVIVVAVPEGLPLAVTLALAFATTRMLKDNNLVRLLRSCETMGNATTICSDKTGTLTQNKMTVVAGTIGTSSRFGDSHGLPEDKTLKMASINSPQTTSSATFEQDVTSQEVVNSLNNEVLDILRQSITINSSAFESVVEGKATFIGSKTETALLEFARDNLGLRSVGVERADSDVVYLIPFDSSRKCMATVIKLSNGKCRMLVKGASEILLARCTRIIGDPVRNSSTQLIDTEILDTLSHIISTYASRSLRTIALTYKDFESWPPKGVRRHEDDSSQLFLDDLLKDMNFISVVGIQDPLRPGVRGAVVDCQRAGVFVRMVTGDNVETARAIATDCGILTEGGLVMEGPDFRRLNKSEMDRRIKKLQVLARSSPEDKRILVKRLKQLGETVAVTGDGTNDAPALKTADIGFSMGIAGTEVAKEASAIILMDDNFASIVKALMWGRAVNDAVKKFLQFQLTVNITAVITTFITGVADATGESVLTAVQLLWVNLIMDTFAALALATDPPSRSILDKLPDRKSAPLISGTMWKQIIGQAIYQLVVTLVLYFKGADILNIDIRIPPNQQNENCPQPNQVSQPNRLTTLIFNAFVWMQIFNAFNNRRLDNRFNIFEGISRNWFFIGILSVMIGGQILIMFVGGKALSVDRITGTEWAISLVLGAITLPVGVIIRLIPNEYCAMLVPGFIRTLAIRPKRGDEEQPEDWEAALYNIQDQLQFLKRVKGGRLNNLKWKIKDRRPIISRSRSSTNTSLRPAIVAAGIAASGIGWNQNPGPRRPSV